MDRPSLAASEPVVIVTACDENYVRGAAATIRSAIDSLGKHRDVRVFVLDGGISNWSKWKLWRSWAAPNVEVGWLKPDLKAIGDMQVSGHITLATYLRILLADLLPSDIGRAIYLDADTIVVGDLHELWSVPLDDAPCAAAQDVFHPYLNPPEVIPHPTHCAMLGQNPQPIPNYRELGLSGTAPYFNAGVMLVNADLWRREQVARRAFDCLRIHAEHVRYWDQYALNTLFSGRWKPVDPRWNQNTQVFRLPGCEVSHYTAEELDQVRRDPWIIHYDYKPKPWAFVCKHPLRDEFFKHLDRTWWRGWRPRPPVPRRLATAYGYMPDFYEAYRIWRRTHVSPAIRSWKKRLLGGPRKAA
jgi:lipopolysaccharide biosynthesis glycosyltransferase